MNKSLHVQKTVHIARAPAVVCRVLTQPENVKQYLYGVPENYAMVTYELAEKPDGTELAVRQQGYPGEESQQSSSAGWDGVIAQIKALAEAAT